MTRLLSLAAVLPLNVWVYAGQLQNLAAAGRKFVLQRGTHRNLAVVKAQVDFIREKVPDAEIVVHPYSGEAGAIGAALCVLDWTQKGEASRFHGFDLIEDVNDMKVMKKKLEDAKRAYPNIAELVREDAFRQSKAAV